MYIFMIYNKKKTGISNVLKLQKKIFPIKLLWIELF